MTAESIPLTLRAVPGDGPYVAAVAALDGIRFTAAAPTRDELVRRLAEYVRENARVQLWPADALRVRALLHLGEIEAAVAHYFARVGGRWDEEWLVAAQVADAGALPLARSA